MTKLSSLLTLSSTRTADPVSAGIDLPAKRRGQVISIDTLNEMTRKRRMSFFETEHQEKILQAYHTFTDEASFALGPDVNEIVAQGFNLSIPLHVNHNHTREEQECMKSTRWDRFCGSGKWMGVSFGQR